MELRSDEWRVINFGVIKPRQLAQKILQGFEEIEDVYQAAADTIFNQLPDMMDEKVSSAPDEVLVGIERIAFMAKNINSMVVGASVGAAVGAAVHLKSGYTVFPVVPSAWQNFLGAKKNDEGKIAAADIAVTTYGLADVPQDAADAIGVAHYIAHTRGRLPFINKNLLLLEHQVPINDLMELGRDAVDSAKTTILATGGGRGKSERQAAFDKSVEDYQAALRAFRKANNLPPMTKVKMGTKAAAKKH